MSKRQFKSQASSGRLGGGFGGFGNSGFGSTQSSALSYIQEPPDYSNISDANVVVAFKNLSKKDSTTKAKALEDIQSYVSSSGVEVEDSLLEAWVKLYPRLSIDSARRVRQLSNVLNGQICSKCGKRVAKHLPRIAGPWLASTYDNDRAAAKAASDAFSLVFPTANKGQELKKTFHSAIVEYCKDAAFNETAKTLSDERNVSTDDSEATYCRVVSTSMLVITNLLTDLPETEVTKQQPTYEEVFADSKLWELVTYSDPTVRRATHWLVHAGLEKQTSLIESHLQSASTAYVYKGLPSDQTGSATDYVRSLTALSARFESIWTDAYSGKKPAVSRLKQFLKHGSRSSNGDFWNGVSKLFTKVPTVVLPTTAEDATDLVLAARDGVSRREERFNASAAWPAYYAIVKEISSNLSEEERNKLFDKCLMPLIRQFLQPSPETAEWALQGGKVAQLVAGAAQVPGFAQNLEQEWPSLGYQLIEAAKMSQPQQSKDFEKSQSTVATAGERWANLQKALMAHLPQSSYDVFATTNNKVLKASVELLRNRDGKPFGTAAVIEEIVKLSGDEGLQDQDTKSVLQGLLRDDDSKWVLWPSKRHLVRCLFGLRHESFFANCFKSALHQLLAQEGTGDDKCGSLLELLPLNAPTTAITIAKDDAALHAFVTDCCQPGPSTLQSELFARLQRLDALPAGLQQDILSKLIASLSDTFDADRLARTLNFFSSMTDELLRAVAAKQGSEQLLPDLLLLEQHENDDIAHKASSLSSRISSVAQNANGSAKFAVVLQNLERLSIKSLSADATQDLTSRLLGPEKKISNPTEVLPDMDTWTKALLAVVRPPKPSLAMLSPLGGALYLVKDDFVAHPSSVQVDADGLSQAMRIGMYVLDLLKETELDQRLVEMPKMRSKVYCLLYLTVLLADDNLSILGCNAMWDPVKNSTAEPMVTDFLPEARCFALDVYWQGVVPEIRADVEAEVTKPSDYASFFSALETLCAEQDARSPIQYYAALAGAKINENLFEQRGHNADQAQAAEKMLRQKRSSKDSLAIAACIAGLRQPLGGSQLLTRYCNELVADLTDFDVSDASQEQKNLERLIVLNTILATQEDAIDTIAKQRLIFLIKKLVPALDAEVKTAITAEICKALSMLLPGIQDMYGEHWAQILAYLISFWSSSEMQAEASEIDEADILLTNASLRLFATLRKLSTTDEPNDDLVDALKENKDKIRDALIQLLKSANGVSDETHQPLKVTHELLGRELARLPDGALPDADELYALLYTPSRPVQQAAFDLLHKQVPAAQEQISFDAALENKTAQLPDELLSLIIEAPTLDSLVDASFDRTMPLPLQGYLYGWRLLFDHFTSSSYRVKSDYIEQLKEGTYLSGLLTFTFDFLGHSLGKPVDVSKLDIQQYIADSEPSPVRDVHWLLTHLYYLALTHLPSLVKSYYLDIRSRQTSLAVESWTAKYISPLIIQASLQGVAEWSAKEEEKEKMSVKVGMRSREINVGYIVDEQTMAIKVVLPDAYPLASAQVLGVSRVAVKEEKWQSWLRNCQGVITFSNGSITDGLSAWRKNVTGALQNAQECAICYSVIDAQKQLPTKRCPTCRNIFHGYCLYKWFKTSNASTCPLCRSAFNFN